MSQKKRGLGRGFGDMGLTELLSSSSATAVEATKPGELREMDVDQLSPGRYQPRRVMDEEALQELASSIKTQGMIQPIVIRAKVTGEFEIIAGERRWRAAQLAGLHRVPVILRDIPDESAIAMALIENLQREDLNAIEEAIALQRLISEFDMTHQQIAEAIGKSRTAVTNMLRLLNLAPSVREFVEKGQLEMGHARALLALETQDQIEAAREIMTRELSVRETEALVRRYSDVTENKAPTKVHVDPNITHLQKELSEKLGAIIKIQHANSGKGKLVIQYNSVDELEGILDHIK